MGLPKEEKVRGKQILDKSNQKGEITTDAEEIKIIMSMQIGMTHWTDLCVCVYICLGEKYTLV